MFDALPSFSEDEAKRFTDALFAMRWDDPRHRRVLELEGLRAWMPPRDEGYESLRAALDRDALW
jgi:ABC-type phosphate/phosphonate transport system substrate-binding protein